MRVVWGGCKGMSALEGEGVTAVPGSDSVALHAWLGQELEVRGIDAVIYTRYILSLLQQEWPDLEEEVAALTLAKKNHSRPYHLSRHTKKKGRHTSPLALSTEKIKKLAAIQCLLDVSEEDSDIEKLVEELYSKLQQQQHKDTCKKIECSDSSHKHEDSREKTEDSDPAERYYAAFPALGSNTVTFKATAVPEGKRWAKVAGSSPRTTDTSQDRPVAKITRVRSSSPHPTYRRKPVFVVPKVNLGRSKSEARSIGGSPVQDLEQKQSSQEWIASLWETFNGKMWLERVMQMMRGTGEVRELKEDMSWYTQPLEMLVPQSPLATQRLYKRSTHPVFYFDFRFSIRDENGNTKNEPGEKLDNDSLARYITQLKLRLEQELNDDEHLVDTDDDNDDDVFVPAPSEFIYEDDSCITPTNDVDGCACNRLPTPPAVNISQCSANADLDGTPITDESFIWALNNSFTDSSDSEETLEKGFKRAKEAEEAFNRVKQLEETKRLEAAKQSKEAEMKLTGKVKQDAEAHILALEENVLNKCKETILDQALEEVLHVVEEAEVDNCANNILMPTYEDFFDNDVFISRADPFLAGESAVVAVTQAKETPYISLAKEAEEAFNKVKWAEEANREKKDHDGCGLFVSCSEDEGLQKSPKLSSGSEMLDNSPQLSASAEVTSEAEADSSCDADEVQDDWETSIKAAIQAAFEISPENDLQEETKTCGVDKMFCMGQKDMSSSSLFEYSGFSDDFPNIGLVDSRFSEEEGTGSLSAAVEAAFHRVDSMSDSINLETTSCSLDDDEDDDIDLNISKLWQLSSPMEDGINPARLFQSAKANRFLEGHDSKMKNFRDEDDDPDGNILNVRPVFTVGDDADMYSPPASLRNSPMHMAPVEPIPTRELCHPLNLELDLTRPMHFPCDQSPIHMWVPVLNCEICLGSTCNCQMTWENCLDLLGKHMTPWGNRATPWGNRGTPWTPVIHNSLFGPLCTPEYMYDDDFSQSLSHSLNMLLSPNQDGRLTSQLWDVNVQGRFDFEPLWECSSTLDSIQKYLFNLNISIQGSASSSFIQGGLYDSSLLPEAAIWQQTVDMDDLFTFMDETWQTSRPEHTDCSSLESLDQLEPPPEIQINCAECHRGSLDGRRINHHRIKMTPESLIFTPSENTAFTASIPRHTNVFPHVQSEPILNLHHLPPPTARLLHVKLLYKSDTNIFAQLGMVAPVGVPSVEVAPNSHFRPIRTPFDGQQVDPNAYKTEDVVSPLNEEEAWRLLGRKSNYQFFRHYIEPEENEFIPKFKVEKERDKSTQTEGEDCYDSVNVIETMFTSDIQSELEISPADAEKLVEEECKTYEGYSESRESPEVSSDYESMGADVSSEDLSGLPLAQLWSGEEEEGPKEPASSESTQNYTSIWSYDGVPGGLPNVPKSSFSNIATVAPPCDHHLSHSFGLSAFKPCAKLADAVDYKKIYMLENASDSDTKEDTGSQTAIVGHQKVSFIHLGKMESQLSRTEFNLGLIVDKSPEHLWSTLEDSHSNGHSKNADLQVEFMQTTSVKQTSPQGTTATDDPGINFDSHEKNVTTDFDQESQHSNAVSLPPADDQQAKDCELDSDAQVITSPSDPQHSSEGSVGNETGFSSQQEGSQLPIYSSDLEKQWLSTETSFVVQVPKPGQRHRLGSRQKPCSFYMEGNCRRVDCKFAHDTSNITCRFWEEGTCFKGITCPFLHGYYKEKVSPNSDDVDNFYIADTEFPELVQLHNKKEEERSSSHTSEDSESAVPIIHRRKQQKSWMKSQGKFQKNKGT